MFFYTSLFIASLIVALVVLWLYHAIVDVGKGFYRAFLPSSKENTTAHLEHETVRSTVNETPTPWGWGGKTKPSQAARTAAVAPSNTAPWGWRGNENKIREHGRNYELNGGAALSEPTVKKNIKNPTGWPYREEKFEFAGKAYKVSRKVAPKKTNLRTTDKPWGW